MKDLISVATVAINKEELFSKYLSFEEEVNICKYDILCTITKKTLNKYQ